jgi:hypothetical protein
MDKIQTAAAFEIERSRGARLEGENLKFQSKMKFQRINVAFKVTREVMRCVIRSACYACAGLSSAAGADSSGFGAP